LSLSAKEQKKDSFPETTIWVVSTKESIKDDNQSNFCNITIFVSI